jgi:hypothetical protein
MFLLLINAHKGGHTSLVLGTVMKRRHYFLPGFRKIIFKVIKKLQIPRKHFQKNSKKNFQFFFKVYIYFLKSPRFCEKKFQKKKIQEKMSISAF